MKKKKKKTKKEEEEFPVSCGCIVFTFKPMSRELRQLYNHIQVVQNIVILL
jgi:hypothetical protein